MSRQRLGQHFLTSSSILERIASAVCPEPCPVVIEIGPGRGALTEHLLKRAERVIAVEVDSALAAYLKARFMNDSRLEIIEADVLETDLGALGPAPIAGNLPYYITSPIIEKCVRLAPPRSVFLIQKEVAERITAQPGEREYGYLTVQVAAFARARTILKVSPGAFQPPPKVDSAAILLEPAAPPAVDDIDAFLRFVGQCFQYKRKTIRNNLAGSYGNEVASWPQAGMRAEQIPMSGFVEMYRRLSKP